MSTSNYSPRDSLSSTDYNPVNVNVNRARSLSSISNYDPRSRSSSHSTAIIPSKPLEEIVSQKIEKIETLQIRLPNDLYLIKNTDWVSLPTNIFTFVDTDRQTSEYSFINKDNHYYLNLNKTELGDKTRAHISVHLANYGFENKSGGWFHYKEKLPPRPGLHEDPRILEMYEIFKTLTKRNILPGLSRSWPFKQTDDLAIQTSSSSSSSSSGGTRKQTKERKRVRRTWKKLRKQGGYQAVFEHPYRVGLIYISHPSVRSF